MSPLKGIIKNLLDKFVIYIRNLYLRKRVDLKETSNLNLLV